MTKNKIMPKGEIIAALVALGFKGDVGPMSGEDPELKGNEVVLESQCPASGYRFNDDGSVEVFFPDKEATHDFLISDCDYEEDDAEAEVEHPPVYNSFEDLCNSGDGWFTYFEDTAPGIYKAIKEVVAFVPRCDRE
jgi:hypothetical protein